MASPRAKQLSQFELDRLARIARIEAECKALQLRDLAAQMQKEQQKPRQSKPRAPKQVVPLEARRKSGRNEGRDRPNYAEAQPLFVFQPRLPRAVKPRQPRAGSSRRAGEADPLAELRARYPTWHPDMPGPKAYAIQDAQQAAEDAAQASKHPAFYKSLAPSTVSLGFWLSAPSGIEAHLEADSYITFTCNDTTRDSSTLKYTQACRNEGELRPNAWSVKFIMKKTDKPGAPSYGMSGNWKGFAKDQFLHADDFIMFEVTSRTSVQMSLFRAWDYAKAADVPADLEQARWTPCWASSAAAEAPVEGAAGSTGAAAAAAGAADAAAAGGGAAVAAAAVGAAGGSRKRGRAAAAAAGPQAAAAAADADGTAVIVKKPRSSSRTAAAAAAGEDGSRRVAAKAVAAAAGAAATQGGGGRAGGSLKRSSSQRAACAEAAAAVAAAAEAAGAGRPARQPASKKAKQQQQQPAGQEEEEEKEEEEDRDFVVESILDTRVRGGVREFRVRWEGFGPEMDKWLPRSNFNVRMREYKWECAIPEGVK